MADDEMLINPKRIIWDDITYDPAHMIPEPRISFMGVRFTIDVKPKNGDAASTIVKTVRYTSPIYFLNESIMKKFLLLLILCAVAVGFAGCDDDIPTSGYLTVTFQGSDIPEWVAIRTAENGELYEKRIQYYKAEFELLPGNYRVTPRGFLGDYWCQVIAGKTTVMSFNAQGTPKSYIK